MIDPTIFYISWSTYLLFIRGWMIQWGTYDSISRRQQRITLAKHSKVGTFWRSNIHNIHGIWWCECDCNVGWDDFIAKTIYILLLCGTLETWPIYIMFLDVQVQRGIFNVAEREKQREEDVWIWKSYINRIVRLEVYNCWAYEQNHLETL